jgi:hypothetical protein
MANNNPLLIQVAPSAVVKCQRIVIFMPGNLYPFPTFNH